MDLVLPNTRVAEAFVQGLTIFTFVLLCWVVHRSVEVRGNCISSSFVSAVKVGEEKVFNCRFEDRLGFSRWGRPISQQTRSMVRTLEVLEPLREVFPDAGPTVVVEIDVYNPFQFEAQRGYLKLGSDWLNDDIQTKRALVMTYLQTRAAASYASQFQLEVMTDFILLAAFREESWKDPATQQFRSFIDEVKFPTTSSTFAQYCLSPFRSLAHLSICQLPEPDSEDLHINVWGFRPLLAAGLWRTYSKLPLRDKLRALHAIRHGFHSPSIRAPVGSAVPELIAWYDQTLKAYMHELKVAKTEKSEWLVKQTLRELDVETPTRWELTIDLTHTPAWREIVTQMREYSRLHMRERLLIFTPSGPLAFPSGLPVAWSARDVQSQKHVMIACQWPKPKDAIAVTARHLFAHQTCDKLKTTFWN